jgi:hypothetical protein
VGASTFSQEDYNTELVTAIVDQAMHNGAFENTLEEGIKEVLGILAWYPYATPETKRKALLLFSQMWDGVDGEEPLMEVEADE